MICVHPLPSCAKPFEITGLLWVCLSAIRITLVSTGRLVDLCKAPSLDFPLLPLACARSGTAVSRKENAISK
eukprot:5400798-Pleurochrysis_carterae.AAC.1